MGIRKNTSMSFGEFMNQNQYNRSALKKQKEKKNSRDSHLILRLGLLLVCLVVLLTVTIGNADMKSVFTDFVNSNNVFSVMTNTTPAGKSSAAIVLANKPSWPGCAASSYRKLSAEQIAEKVRPCVVGIIQYQKNMIQESGEGSGIIMSSSGYILTNNHVVDGSSKLIVVFQNGKKFEAKIVGRDARTDIAVVKVNASELTAAKFGNSDQCGVGEQVIAIGNPSGIMLAGSVTQGIISAINRNVDVGNGPMNLIQTDAAINPGNSGGALVNMYGQVIGINSAKISQQGYEGIGFSIPINTVKPVVDSIMKYGYVQGRVKFGFNCRAIDETTAKLNDIPAGIYIDAVDQGGGAAQGGLKADDIITGIDGRPVRTTDDLIAVRDRHKPGDEVALSVYRRSTKQQLGFRITLTEENRDAQTFAAGKAPKGSNW